MNNLANESVNNIIMKVVMECSKHYGFNSEEAMIRLGLLKSNENEGKVVVDKVVVDKVVVDKVVVDKVVVVDKSKKEKEKRIPLPYNGEEDKNCCLGITLNHGLYTQCEKKRKENDLCETCDKQAKKNDSGKPDYGRMEDRQQVGWMEYRDPKGKKPIAYIKLMKKLGLTKEEVLKEAGKRKKKIDEMHFEEEEEEKKKGRPKKSVKVLEVEGETNDLFAELIASVNPNPNPNAKEEEKEEEKEKEKKLAATPRLEEEEVVAPVAVAVVKKEKVVKEKVLKEPKEKVLKEKVVKEKVLKEPKEKVLKEKVLKEKVVKEKVLKEPKEKVEEKEKVVKEKVLKEPKEKVEEKEKEEGEVEVEEEADVVKRFEYEGIKYLKSKKTGIIYNMEQDVVGKWNEETQKIDFETEEEDSEEEEEEYDE
jgi:hypothetical protein